MVNLLIWSDRAREEYSKLQEYLYAEWGEEIARRVIKEIAQTVDRIQNSPEHFPVFSKKRKIRRCVASPQTSIFFNANRDRIEIVSVFDNRQNPKKRKL
ncbi:MAG TPA: type II toxin-antitoxin system RelE/ParE family toxin [Mucilaginibacter sp.]|jgi:plasmid stabilization system protein ParE